MCEIQKGDAKERKDVMKTRVLLITGLFALSMIAVGRAQAQQVTLAKIPFAFTAGEATLPAGEYRIGRVNDHSGALVLNDQDDTDATAMINTNAAQANQAPTRSKL